MRIPNDLMATINPRLDGCDSQSIDISIGCSHACIYCHFSDYQKTLYKKIDRSYKGETIPLNLSQLLKETQFPDRLYFSYATDLFTPKLRENAHLILEHVLKHGARILIITKGIIPDSTLAMLNQYNEQVSLEYGLTSLCDERRRLIEPGTPKVDERLKMLQKIGKTKIAYTCLRIDPIFPLIDDSDEEIKRLLNNVSGFGVSNIVASYIIASDRMMRKMSTNDQLIKSLSFLTEKTPTVATAPQYSVPLDYKLKKISKYRIEAEKHGMKLHTCACKDARLKKLDTSYQCHPFETNTFIKNSQSSSELNIFSKV